MGSIHSHSDGVSFLRGDPSSRRSSSSSIGTSSTITLGCNSGLWYLQSNWIEIPKHLDAALDTVPARQDTRRGVSLQCPAIPTPPAKDGDTRDHDGGQLEMTVAVAANRIIRCFVIVASTIRQGRAARIAQIRILRPCFISSSLLHRLVKKPRSAGSRAAPLRHRFVSASDLPRRWYVVIDPSSDALVWAATPIAPIAIWLHTQEYSNRVY